MLQFRGGQLNFGVRRKQAVSFIAVRWLHSNSEDPIELYSELDAERNEVRKVEVFADGRAHYADANSSTGDTILGSIPIPSLAEIADDPQFVPHEIAVEEFESIWQAARCKCA